MSDTDSQPLALGGLLAEPFTFAEPDGCALPPSPWKTTLEGLPTASITLSGLWEPAPPPDPGPGLTLTVEQGVYEVTGSATFRSWWCGALEPDVSPHTRRAVRRGQAVVGRILGSDRRIVLLGDFATPFHHRRARLSRMHSMYRRRNR